MKQKQIWKCLLFNNYENVSIIFLMVVFEYLFWNIFLCNFYLWNNFKGYFSINEFMLIFNVLKSFIRVYTIQYNTYICMYYVCMYIFPTKRALVIKSIFKMAHTYLKKKIIYHKGKLLFLFLGNFPHQQLYSIQIYPDNECYLCLWFKVFSCSIMAFHSS